MVCLVIMNQFATFRNGGEITREIIMTQSSGERKEESNGQKSTE
jgi:hypothetical protein